MFSFERRERQLSLMFFSIVADLPENADAGAMVIHEVYDVTMVTIKIIDLIIVMWIEYI